MDIVNPPIGKANDIVRSMSMYIEEILLLLSYTKSLNLQNSFPFMLT